MKVIIVGPAFPLRGGIADFNEALAIGFTKEGVETELFSFYMQYPSVLFPGKSQKTDGPVPHGLTIHSTLSSINPLTWYRTAKLIIRQKPDLVIVRYWLPFMAPSLGTLASLLRKRKIKVIAITDNVNPHEKRMGDKLLTGYFVKNCDGFVAMSSSVLTDLSGFTSNQNKVFLPHPVYDIFGLAIPKEEARRNIDVGMSEKLILFFGFIRAYKGLDMLIEAMKDRRLRAMKVKLLIAGEFYDDPKPYLEKIQSIDGGENFVLRNDYINKEKVKDYFCAADMVVQPYKSATQSGITQIAYHFSRPMLVTNVGGLAEIVPDGKAGYVVETNPGAIADAIYNFYSANRESEFAKRVADDREKFSWYHFITGILKLYEKIK